MENRITEKNGCALCGKYSEKDAAVKLSKYENMQQDLEDELEKVIVKLAELKKDGKSSTVTYRQLIASKLTLQNILNRYKVYGL